jgi:hypothetical protein
MKWPCSGPNAPSAVSSTSNRRSSACRALTAVGRHQIESPKHHPKGSDRARPVHYHTHRYLQFGGQSSVYDLNASTAEPGGEVPRGSQICLAAGTEVTDDDDSAGGVKDGTASDFCMELSRSGNLEVWHAPLSHGRHAVAFVNRSPVSSQKLSLDLVATLGLKNGTSYTAKDVWAGKILPKAVPGTLASVVKEPHGSNFYIPSHPRPDIAGCAREPALERGGGG